MTDFCCPVCAEPLTLTNQTYRCPKGHSFDCSKHGYVNLLNTNSKKGHGDNKEMLLARRNFLQAGFYNFLADAVAAQVANLCPKGGAVLDIGCGEGYYTERILAHLSPDGSCVFGTDISKDAVSLAARNGLARYAVCANKKLPFADGSIDVITALFTPLDVADAYRALRPGGWLLHVVPDEEHLFGLKQALYAQPYRNTDVILPPPAVLNKTTKLSRTATVCGEDIWNLFQMTPYYYKTSKEAQGALKSTPRVITDFAFVLHLYTKPKDGQL